MVLHLVGKLLSYLELSQAGETVANDFAVEEHVDAANGWV